MQPAEAGAWSCASGRVLLKDPGCTRCSLAPASYILDKYTLHSTLSCIGGESSGGGGSYDLKYVCYKLWVL